MIYSIHFSGLGGQGVLTLTKLLAEYTRAEGYTTTLFNSKGMAQRGGRVTSDIRISSDSPEQSGEPVEVGPAPQTAAPQTTAASPAGAQAASASTAEAGHNPVSPAVPRTADFESRIGEGNADLVVGLEIGEAVNSLPIIKPEGTALLYTRRSIPANIVLDRHAHYPEAEEVRDLFSRRCMKVLAVPETDGSANIYILGILAAILPEAGSFFRIDFEKLEKILRGRLKRDIQLNLQIMKKGYEYGRELVRSF